jgi:hypothetical protein
MEWKLTTYKPSTSFNNSIYPAKDANPSSSGVKFGSQFTYHLRSFEHLTLSKHTKNLGYAKSLSFFVQLRGVLPKN